MRNDITIHGPKEVKADMKITAELGAMISIPFERLAATPDGARIVALAIGLVQLLYNDLWAVALFFMVACAGVDFWSGVTRARLAGPDVFSATIAHRGLATKIISLCLTFLVRILEHVLFLLGIGDTRGMITVVALAGFGIADIRSIMAHREAMGGGPIPVVSSLIDKIEGLLGSRADTALKDSPRRRKGETP